MPGGLSIFDMGGLDIMGGWVSTDLLPTKDNTFDLGSASFSWKNAHFQTAVYATSVVGNWSPSVTNTYDLGTSSLYWKDLYVNDVYIVDTKGLKTGTTSGDYFSLFGYAASAYHDAIRINTSANYVEVKVNPDSGDVVYFDIYGGTNKAQYLFSADCERGTIGLGCYAPPITSAHVLIDYGAATTGLSSSFSRVSVGNGYALSIVDSATAAYIDTLLLSEPKITLGAGSVVTTSSVLRISSAATEATNNYAIYVSSGASRFGGIVNIVDDTRLALGTTSDSVFYHRTAVLNANTALTGVLIGTPVTKALAANSLIISNITSGGGILGAVNIGGHSNQWLWVDGATGVLHLGKSGTPSYAAASGDVFIAGLTEFIGYTYHTTHVLPRSASVDLGSTALPFRILNISGAMWIRTNIASFAINSDITSGSAAHTIKLQIDANDIFGVGATGNGAGGIDVATLKSTSYANLVMGTGEGGVTLATGKTLRAPSVIAGGAGNIAGADLTITPGAGTGVGDAGQVIFQTYQVAATGDNLQTTLETILTIDEDTIEIAEAKDIVLGTTTGTKIGTATAQKLGFFNATPVVQQTGVAAQKVNYATPELDTEAEIIAAFNTTNAAINTLRTAINALGLTTTV